MFQITGTRASAIGYHGFHFIVNPRKMGTKGGSAFPQDDGS